MKKMGFSFPSQWISFQQSARRNLGRPSWSRPCRQSSQRPSRASTCPLPSHPSSYWRRPRPSKHLQPTPTLAHSLGSSCPEGSATVTRYIDSGSAFARAIFNFIEAGSCPKWSSSRDNLKFQKTIFSATAVTKATSPATMELLEGPLFVVEGAAVSLGRCFRTSSHRSHHCSFASC